jgi:hypothetical protein
MAIPFMIPILMMLGAGCTVQPLDAPAPPADTTPVAAPAHAPAHPAPATTESEAAAPGGKLSADASLDQILDALDRRGRDLQSFAADVTLIESDASTGDEIERGGSIALQLQPDGSARSRITFDRKVANNLVTEERIDYVLDGPNLIDRSYRTRTQVTRQVLRPGEKINLLKLGEGPFPLPIGQDKEEVKGMFEVRQVPPGPGDPPNTVRVQLSPRPGSQFAHRFESIEAWVDLDDHMPKRIETIDANGVTVRTTDLSNVRINEQLRDEVFILPRIDPNDWTLLSEPYHE